MKLGKKIKITIRSNNQEPLLRVIRKYRKRKLVHDYAFYNYLAGSYLIPKTLKSSIILYSLFAK